MSETNPDTSSYSGSYREDEETVYTWDDYPEFQFNGTHPDFTHAAVKDVLQHSAQLITDYNKRDLTGSYFVIDELTQHAKTVVTSHYLSKDQLAFMHRQRPYIQVKAGMNQRYHPHPILNLEREEAEFESYNLVLQFCRNRGQEDPVIIDIDGNASRHRRHKRRNVWCCNPVSSSQSHARNFLQTTPLNTNRCNHDAITCGCVIPSAFLSIDSLYYLTPDKIAHCCIHSIHNFVVATAHEFGDAFGSFANGEATYQLLDFDRVSMSVNGNLTPYVHNSLTWIKRGSYSIPNSYWLSINKAPPKIPATLVWTKHYSVGDHHIYYFTVVYTYVPPPLPAICSFSSALQDKNYYGKVTSGVFSEPNINVTGDILSIPDTKLYSFGPWMFVYQKSHNTTIYAPKTMVSEAALYINGKPRTSENFAILLAWLRQNAKKINVPAHMLADCIHAIACLGFVERIGQEVTNYHGIIKPMLKTIEIHTDATKFKFKRVWTFKGVATAVLAAVSLAGTAAAAAHVVLPTVATLTVASAALGAVSVADTALSTYNAFNTVVNPLANYPAASINHTGIFPIAPNTTFPGVDPSQSIQELLEAKIDVSAKISCPDETLRRETTKVVPAGIVSSDAPPVAPSNSAHSNLSTLVGRMCKEQVFNTPDFDDNLFILFEKFVVDNFTKLFGDMSIDPVKPVPFETWVKRSTFPLSQQKKLREAQAKYLSGEFKDWNVDQRQSFVKAELLSKSTHEGVEGMCPRGIQGATDVHNVATGPYCYGFSARLKEVWNHHKNRGLIYSTGVSGEVVGEAFDRAVKSIPDHTIMEGDFKRFDSTIHRRLLELAIKIHKMCGANKKVLKAFTDGIKKFGRMKFDITYEVDGTRCSGDQNTSCDNSMLQGLAILFALHIHTGKPVDELLSEIVLFLLGDDNLLIAPSSMLENFDAVGILLKLGFNLDPKFHTGPEARYKASFCSSLFWPCEDPSGKEVVVLAPKLGRTYAKIGWYCNPQPNIDMNRVIRGDILGRQKDCSMLPCIRHYINKVIQLTGHIANNRIFKDKTSKRKEAFEFHCGEMYKANDHTFLMSNIVYGIGKQHDEEYRKGISSISSLPSGFNYPPLKNAACIDEVLTGLAASEIEALFNTSSTTAPTSSTLTTKTHDLPNGHAVKFEEPRARSDKSNKKQQGSKGLKGGTKMCTPPIAKHPNSTNLSLTSQISKTTAPKNTVEQKWAPVLKSHMEHPANKVPEVNINSFPELFSKPTKPPMISVNKTAMIVDSAPISPVYQPHSPVGHNAQVFSNVAGYSPSSPVYNPFEQKNIDDTMLELALDMSRVDIKINN